MNNQEYRERLWTKLNALVSVLEVAIAKIENSMTEHVTEYKELDRLATISVNLVNTLKICKRAQRTLERAMPERKGAVGAREYVEFMGIEEYRKFKSLPPIDAKEVASVDMEELIRKLS